MSAPKPVIGYHLIWTLYGHCLANDLRGSGSEDVRDTKFEPLGVVHRGRRPEHLQPARAELKEFFTKANPLLNFAPFWLDKAKRQALGDIVGGVVAERNYTVWACAILSNHMHLVVRRHRDDGLAIWRAIADVTRLRLCEFPGIDAEHPVWAARPYKVYLRAPYEIRTRVKYVERNPEKEGLPRQSFDFVTQYNNWPFHKPR